MPRKLTIRTNDFPYHVTARVNNRERFPLEPSLAWKILTDELYVQTSTQGARVHAFVVMPNHFHLLSSTSEAPIDLIMRDFMRATTKEMNHHSRRSGHLYGGHYRSCLIRDPLYYAHALKYVYRNPVKAELCQWVEDWTASTISGIFGRAWLPIQIFRPKNNLDQLLPEDHGDLLKWLNYTHKKEENLAIQRALRKKEFALSVDRRTRKPQKLRAPDAP